MNEELRRYLGRTNPWMDDAEAARRAMERRLPERFVPRLAAADLRAKIERPGRAHLVIGPRQAGKSTLLLWLLAEKPSPLLLLSCEEPLVRQWCASPGLFAADLREWLPPGGTVLFEEAQWLKEAGLFLKGLVDAAVEQRLLVTGSASFHLLARTRESLAGRASRHHVWPFSLGEVAAGPSDRAPAAQRLAAARSLDRMLVYGGYPEAWTAEDPRAVLDELVTAFVLRDASDRFRIERPDAFRRMLGLAAGQVGDLVRFSEWAQVLGIATTTVIAYASLLEETHILTLLRPFIGGQRAELTQAPKIYFLDNGLRNAVAGGFAPLGQRTDLGKLLESWVLTELHKRHPEPGAVRYWRTRNGAEVDFVLEPEPGRIVAVEVKAQAGPPTRLPRALRSFAAAYHPERILLVYRGEPAESLLEGVPVLWTPAELLPEALDAARL